MSDDLFLNCSKEDVIDVAIILSKRLVLLESLSKKITKTEYEEHVGKCLAEAVSSQISRNTRKAIHRGYSTQDFMYSHSELFAIIAKKLMPSFSFDLQEEFRTALLSQAKDANQRKNFSSSWGPFKRAWLKNEADEYIAISLREKVATSGNKAGHTGRTAANKQYESGEGKKGY